MKKRLKVFEAGKYPQGEFSEDRVEKIFGSVTGSVEGIFSHSSKWLTENKDPVSVGEFQNFSIEKGIVYADVEFNDKGASYYRDGILKGVSVEIAGDKLTKIAVLPVGIKPAVTGAEFQEEAEGITVEFEEVKELTIAEIITALKSINVAGISQAELEQLNSCVWDVQDHKWAVNKLQDNGYTVQKEFSKEELEGMAKPLGFQLVEFQEEAILSKEEIKAQVRAEMEFEAKVEKLKADSKTKIPPVLQPFVEFALEKAGEERETIIEFSETEKVSMFEKMASTIEAMPKHPTQITHHNNLEFEKNGEIDYMAKSRVETEKLYGGK